MSNLKQFVCNISKELVNEYFTRVNAFLGILLTASGFISNSVIFLAILIAYFYILGFTNNQYSPLGYISHRMVNTFNLGKKEIDKAQKNFAARIGFLMSLTITIFNVASA
jgi:hypothetical protein